MLTDQIRPAPDVIIYIDKGLVLGVLPPVVPCLCGTAKKHLPVGDQIGVLFDQSNYKVRSVVGLIHNEDFKRPVSLREWRTPICGAVCMSQASAKPGMCAR